MKTPRDIAGLRRGGATRGGFAPPSARRRLGRFLLVAVAAVGLGGGIAATRAPVAPVPGSLAGAPGIDIDFAAPRGVIRPLHGVNNGPLISELNIDLSVFHAAAGFPATRLHDSHRPYPDVVDIHCLFPDFAADPENPASYRFKATDDYLLPIVAHGSQIIFRLGESIEHSPRKLHVHPPGDFQKWAAVCVNIIRHYNEGWADGFHHGIRYWEIWNEPESSHMWTGTPEQFLALYEVAARAIKNHDPTLKVGGPGASGVGTKIVQPFLAYCRDRQVPLDFFSWHRYARDADALVRGARRARELLDEYGFRTTESHLNEWHYFDLQWSEMVAQSPADYAKVRDNFLHLAGPEAAAFAAAALMRLQDAPVDVCNYYTADNSRWGMFDQYGVPGRVYHAFLAFNDLMKTPRRVACSSRDPDPAVTVMAGLAPEAKAAAVLLANTGREPGRRQLVLGNLPWHGPTLVEILAVDQTHEFAVIAEPEIAPEAPTVELELPVASIRLIRLAPRH